MTRNEAQSFHDKFKRKKAEISKMFAVIRCILPKWESRNNDSDFKQTGWAELSLVKRQRYDSEQFRMMAMSRAGLATTKDNDYKLNHLKSIYFRRKLLWIHTESTIRLRWARALETLDLKLWMMSTTILFRKYNTKPWIVFSKNLFKWILNSGNQSFISRSHHLVTSFK